MAAINAADVAKLRRVTLAGMMDCKKALEESEGNFDKAIEIIRKNEFIPKIDTFAGSNIVYNKNGKSWLHLTSDYKKDELNPENQGICSLDPGIRTFQTIYSPNGHVYKIGSSDVSRLMRLCYHLDKLQSKYNKAKKKKHYKRALYKARRRIRNIVDELHCKSINFLIKNFRYIIIPNTNLKSMTLKKNRKLNNKTVRNLLTLSHYRFRERLIMKSKIINGLKIIVLGEEYTSKTCGKCGELNEIGSKKDWKCNKCKVHIDRDINGARNIMIKYMTERLGAMQADAKQ